MITQKALQAKNSLLLILILAVAGPSAPLLAQQEIPTELTTVKLEDGFAQGRTPFQWFIATYGMLATGTMCVLRNAFPQYMAKNMFAAQDTLSPEVKTLARNVIIKHGIDPDTIILLHSPATNVALAVGQNVMLLNGDVLKNYTPEEIEFLVGHELAHLQNKDIIKMGLVALSLPVIAHFGLKAWDAGVTTMISGIKQNLDISQGSRTDTALTKLNDANHWASSFCFTTAIVASKLFSAYSCRLEKQADLSSVHHLNTHDGAHKFFKRLQEEQKPLRDKFFINKLIINEEGDNLGDELHPLLSERIKYTTHESAPAA